jgi:streptogramin lyase
VTTSGALTEYSIPISPDSEQRKWIPAPGVITAAGDGNLWILHGFAFERLTTSGVFTEYPVLTSSSIGVLIRGLVMGPDGNLWFTEDFQGQHHQVGRLVVR